MSKSREFKFLGALSLNSVTDGDSSSKSTFCSSEEAVDAVEKL
jgi:hypothetical protein